MGQRDAQRGTGYLVLLLTVFLLALGLGKVLDVHSRSVQRQREEELAHVGGLYRDAIRDYYLSAPDGQRRYPRRLDDLLRDRRHLATRRYLRQLYPDPITARPFIVLTAPDGGIQGVVSSSDRAPLRLVPPASATVLGPVHSYGDWQFVHRAAD
jgi:type II secretory pathway pseudopilin PulG